MQRTHGFGVRPAAYSARNGCTTPAANAARRSIVRCGSPIRCATERASRTAWAEQHDASASFAGSRQSSSVTAIASRPARCTSSAATAESTPPDIATSVRPGTAGAARATSACTAAPSATWSASAARSAAWSLPGDRPPSSAAISAGPIRAASSSGAPSSSVTAADPAAIAAPQPDASKPAVGDAVAVQREPDPHEVAARGAAGRAGERGHVPAPARELEVLGEGLGVHAPSVGG